MMQNQETYAAFINLEKAFGKIWGGATFYLLWKRGNRKTLPKTLKDHSQAWNLDY